MVLVLISVAGKQHTQTTPCPNICFGRSAAEKGRRVVLLHKLFHGVEKPLPVALSPQYVCVVSGGMENIDKDTLE